MTPLNLASEQLKADWQRDAGYPEIVRDDFAAGELLQGQLIQEANADAGSRMAIIPIVAGLALLFGACYVGWLALPAVLGWLLELPVWFR